MGPNKTVSVSVFFHIQIYLYIVQCCTEDANLLSFNADSFKIIHFEFAKSLETCTFTQSVCWCSHTFRIQLLQLPTSLGSCARYLLCHLPNQIGPPIHKTVGWILIPTIVAFVMRPVVVPQIYLAMGHPLHGKQKLWIKHSLQEWILEKNLFWIGMYISFWFII